MRFALHGRPQEGGETGITPLAFGTKKQKFLENLKVTA